ncbi:MAG: diacylglycerol kinase family lipid kinase [Chloroflexi bacterium]|nr:diacylglycerol kinase family lipid kinase [Chloroflexota bacterium]
MRTAHLIYNPLAGRFPAGPFLERSVKVMESAGWHVVVEECHPGRDLADLARQAVARKAEAVFVAGGDGSVGPVAGVLAGTETAMGVLPAGTANVFAQELGLPRMDWAHWFAVEEAAGKLARGHVRLVDIGMCNNRPFLLWAGVGLDGKVVNSIEPRDRWEKTFGVLNYAILTLWTSLDWTGLELRVTSGERTWEGRYLVAVASNIRSYAGGLMELAPSAKVDDGQLDFWLITGGSMVDAVVRVVQVLLGMHVDHPGVVHFQASEATFECAYPLPVHLDGEPTQLGSFASFSTRQRTLRLLVPEGMTSKAFSPLREVD